MLFRSGVVKLLEPVAKAVPPVAAAYQSIVSPAPGVAEIVTVPVEQRAALPAVGADGKLFTVAVTAVLEDEIQPVVEFLDSA